MKRKDLFDLYHQGPEAVISYIERLEARIQVLELQGKKTPKTATSRRLPTYFISQNQKAFGKKPIENLVDSLDMSVTH